MTSSTIPTKPEAITDETPDMGIYVECKATLQSMGKYGAWIDLGECEEASDITDAIDFILKTSPTPNAKEWEITDNTAPTFLIGKPWPRVMEWLQDHRALYSESMQDAFEEYTNDVNYLPTKATFEEAFQGFWADEEDFTFNRYEDAEGELSALHDYIDWGAVWEGEYEKNGWTYCHVQVALPRGTYSGNLTKYRSRVAIFKPV
tara:strand:+ start:782 stop:1393 length:612 start_codon:yes stop_codon:yes gene_type:complete